MDEIKDIIPLLQFLLPGFISAWLFYGLTSYPKPAPFERIIQALIFTLFAQIVVHFIEAGLLFLGQWISLGTWDNRGEYYASILSGIIIGLAFSYFANNDKFHAILRWLKITNETSYASEWSGTFSNPESITYVVLHFYDERRLMGWPMEWAAEPETGYFQLVDASWLDDDKEIPLTNVKHILVKASDIKWVEFLESK